MQERSMRGVEISEAFFREYGMPLLKKYPQLEKHVAAGLCGAGSECYGFDDEISRDHDWGPSFCLWVDDTVPAADRFLLEKEYAKLPTEFMGYSVAAHSRGGDGRRGVIGVGEYYRKYTGASAAPDTLEGWLYTPDECFAEAVNGKVFFDGGGEFTHVRAILMNGRPEDVRLKKIAARAAEMAQYGQYNYPRCVERGERGAAALALSGFVLSACKMIFLLNRSYCPYYKWAIRALRDVPILGNDMADVFEYLLVGGDEFDRVPVIEDVCAMIIKEMKNQGISDHDSDYLEAHAYSVMEHISDTGLRNMHVMTG